MIVNDNICKLLSSFIFLFFKENRFENEYAKYKEESLDYYNKRNLVMSFFLILISAFSMLMRKVFSEVDQNLVIDVLNIVLIIMNSVSALYSLIEINKFNFLKRKISNYDILLGINYISLCLNSFFIFTQIKLNTENFEKFVFVNSLMFCLNILIVFTFCYNYKIIFVGGFLALTIEFICMKYYFTYQTSFIYLVLSLNFISCLFISYLNEAREKSSFLLLKRQEYKISSLNEELKHLSYYKELCDNLKMCFFTINKNSNVEYVNKSMCKIIKTYQSDNFEFATTEKEFESIPSTSVNNFFLLFHNYEYKENNINLEEQNKNVFTHVYIQNILSKISVVNEDLIQINKELYDYLSNIRISNLRRKFGEKQEFNFEEFMKIIGRNYEESDYKTLGVIDQSNLYSNKLFPKRTNTNYNISSNLVNTETMLKENAVLLNLERREKLEIKYEKCQNVNKSNKCDYIFLGKISLESLQFNLGQTAKKKDYPVYLILMSNFREVTLLIEDNHYIIKRERKETAKVCKSLYLSKISHEFKNPICNLQELTSSLSDELNSLGLVKKQRSPIFDYSYTAKNESPSGSDQDSFFDGGVSLIKEKEKEKTENKYLANCVNNLKCTTDMMLQILKDFTFYSRMIDDIEELQISPNQLERRGSVINKSLVSSPAFEGEKKSPGNSICLINKKECEYKDVIRNVLNIFLAKTILDNRQSKFTFNVNFQGSLPEVIEIEKDHFSSLMFNIMYHLYKNVVSGKVEIVISPLPSSLNINNSSNCTYSQILFEVFVYGVTNIKELTENIIIDTDESKRSKGLPTYENRHNKKNDSKQTRDLSPSFFVEHFHLKNIFSLSDNSLRNKFIDNFNKNFHYYLIQIYSKRLNINLNFDTSRRDELKIFFNIVNKYPETVSKFATKHLISSSRESVNNSAYLNTGYNKINSIQAVENYKRKKVICKRRNTIGFTSPFNFRNSPVDRQHRSGSFKRIEEVVEDTKRTVINESDMNFDYSFFINTNNGVKQMLKISSPVNNPEIVIGNCTSSRQEESSNKTETLISLKDSLAYSNATDGNHHRIQHRKLSSNSSFREQSIIRVRKRLSEIVLPTSKSKLENSQFTYTHQRNTYRKSESSNSNSSRRDSKESKVKKNLNDDVIRVLLCDDENLIRKTLHRFLNIMTKDDPSLIFDVQHSKDGFDCLHKIYENYNKGQYFDVLIIDETMPLVKGSQVINLLKTSMKESDFRSFTVVSFTSYNSPDKIDYIHSQGADFVLSKPIDYNDFKKFFVQLPKRSEV